MMGKRLFASFCSVFIAFASFIQTADALVETPSLAERVSRHELPAVEDRVPKTPLVADLLESGRRVGEPGGEIVTIVARTRDIRYISAYSYARLVGYDENLTLKADLLERIDVDQERVFTLTLREGHRWSDGAPFTTEDIRYWWEDVTASRDLNPSGPPEFMLIDGKPPKFEILDARRVRFTWDTPNPHFLPMLASPRDPFIYRPAHYLKHFHAKYANPEALDKKAKALKLKSWAALHNRMDDMFENSNPDLPTLQPWRITNAAPATRFVFERNPYYHRVDTAGHQLPYLDRIIVDVASGGLMAAKSNAGDADFMARGLTMGDAPVLKEGEASRGYGTRLWPIARGSEVALYPNLTVSDPVWRALNRDVRYRRALSLGVDRRTLNNALLFGLGREGNNTVLEGSNLYQDGLRLDNAVYNPTEASRLLDEIGLTNRNGEGTRLLSDGRPLEIVVEVDSEAGPVSDALELIAEFWREIGIKLLIKPQERSVLRNRVYAGLTIMTAAPGLDNAAPTALMPPTELAPVRQDHYAWAKWGQFVETKGQNGEACDTPDGMELLSLYHKWETTLDEAEKTRIWHAMLALHVKNQWTIGTVAGALQPIVVRNGLKNLPVRALYGWEPMSLVGVYRMDEVYWEPKDRRH